MILASINKQQTSNLASIDFEFFDSKNKMPQIVCAVLRVNGESFPYWLLNSDSQKNIFLKHVESLSNSGHYLLSFGAMSEARCLLALGFDVSQLQFIDLYSEYRTVANHNNKITYGEHLIDGQIKKTSPSPGYKITGKDHSKPEFNLASACFKFLNVRIDLEEKEQMRNIIISGDTNLIEKNRDAILAYCESDVLHLHSLYDAIVAEYTRLGIKSELSQYMLQRGRWAVLNAKIEHEGMPLNLEHTRNFARNVPHILRECQQDINSLFSDIRPFKFKKLSCDYSWDQTATKKWVENYAKIQKVNWTRTPKGDFALDLETWQEHFNFAHSYPRDNFGAQIVRYLKLKQSLNGFMPKKPTAKNKRTFFDTVGTDGRARPFLGIYGSQSGRSQPPSTGFLFLKPAWMRALCQPKPGEVCFSIDFSSQEFLIAGLLSGDENMIAAYNSGDVYLYFAKLAGAIPWDGTKDAYGRVRDLFKATVLGIQFGMAEDGLSVKLTNDMGEYISPARAYSLIQKFERAFATFVRWKVKMLKKYEREKRFTLPCGFMMFGDNPNRRSILNMPVQGTGSSILRFSVDRADKAGIRVFLTLHDAIYAICRPEELQDKIWDLAQCMYEGFKDGFAEQIRPLANIRLEGKAWGPDLSDDFKTINGCPMSFSELMIDKRAMDDYNRFSPYFYKKDGSVYL